MIDFLLEMLYGADFLSLLFFLVGFLLFSLFFTLGIVLFRFRFLPSLCFLLSLCALLCIPPAIVYSSKHFFHKVEIVSNDSKPLSYSPTFLIDVKFINRGKFDFNKCLFSLTPKKESDNILDQIKQKIKPIAKFRFMVRDKIRVNESYEFSKILPQYHYRGYDYDFDIDCR